MHYREIEEKLSERENADKQEKRFAKGEASRAVIVVLTGDNSRMYGEKIHLQEIASSMPSLAGVVQILPSCSNWGPFLRSQSIATPFTLLLASGYAFLRHIDWIGSDKETRSAQIWAKKN